MPDNTTDITIFGATGLVGRLAARYLASQGIHSVALAGRNGRELEQLRSQCAQAFNAAQSWTVITADAKDEAALGRMVGATQVVIATAGPYTELGEPLVGLCAKAGVDYVDLCGEALFIRNSIDQHHLTAGATGARIVHSCGFDSVPSDMGVFALHQFAGQPFRRIRMVIEDLRGGISQGTLASMRAVSAAAHESREAARLLHNPYTLDPNPQAGPRLEGLEKDFTIENIDGIGWVGPFFMSMFNTRVVRRSNALRERDYGERLYYKESWGTGQGVRGRLGAIALALVTKALFDGTQNRLTRPLVTKLIPRPGGKNRGFRATHHGWTESGEHYTTTVQATGDPGYEVTAMMLSEAARCLLDSRRPGGTGGSNAADGNGTATNAGGAGGVLTPATALGNDYLERLQAHGMSFHSARR